MSTFAGHGRAMHVDDDAFDADGGGGGNNALSKRPNNKIMNKTIEVMIILVYWLCLSFYETRYIIDFTREQSTCKRKYHANPPLSIIRTKFIATFHYCEDCAAICCSIDH